MADVVNDPSEPTSAADPVVPATNTPAVAPAVNSSDTEIPKLKSSTITPRGTVGRRGRLTALIVVLIILALVAGSYYYYQHYYHQTKPMTMQIKPDVG